MSESSHIPTDQQITEDAAGILHDLAAVVIQMTEAAPDDVDPCEGLSKTFHIITCRLLDAAMAGEPLLDVDIFLGKQDDTILFRLRDIDVTAFIDGWRPAFQMDARTLQAAFEPIWNADIPLEDAVAFARTTGHAVTLLVDSRSFLLEAATEALTRLSGTNRLASAIDSPANWSGPLPGSAHVWKVEIKRRQAEASE
jgi:hypothetical protein